MPIMKKINAADRWALAVYVLVRDWRGRVLMLRRAQTVTHFPGCWELPGGKPAPGEHFSETAELEVIEETGLCVTPSGVAGAVEGSIPGLRVAMLILDARVPSRSGCEVTLSKEHDTFCWVAPAEAAKLKLPPGFGEFVGNLKKLARPARKR